LAFGSAPIFAQATPHHHSKPAPAKPVDPKAAAPAAAPADADAGDPDDDPNSNGVAAIINDQIVSEYDLRQRLALVISTSAMPPNATTIKRLRPQVLDLLKTEKLELEEAQRKNITVSPTEVDKEIEGIVKDNHLTVDGLKAILAKSGVAYETLRAQIAVQLAWQKAIEDEYGDRVNITDLDVTEELARISEGANKPHYLVSEIFLPVENPEQDEKVHKDADDLEAQIKNGAPFPSIARQFSQSPSAANGGEIGWVHDGQLSPELDAALKKLEIGGMSAPIRATGGYYILALRQRQDPAGTKAQPVAPTKPEKPGYLPLARMLLPMPMKAPQPYVDSAMKAATQIRDHIQSCEQLQKMVAGIHGAVFQNLGEMKLSDLSEQIQGELAKTQSGQPTAPFRDAAGVEVFARCDQRAAPQAGTYTLPTRDEVQKQLFQTQISMLARRYIRDLRRQANIQSPSDVATR
jgi:peptidyl-prolyl cis-trans isomerase SurA